MADTVVSPSVGESAEPEFRHTLRERLGIAAFIATAVVATAVWVGLLVWLAVKLISSF